jgi:hypothetical protein
MAAHRVALVLLVKLLDKRNAGLTEEFTKMLTVFREQMQDGATAEQKQADEWIKAELNQIAATLQSETPSWTPTIIPGGKK